MSTDSRATLDEAYLDRDEMEKHEEVEEEADFVGENYYPVDYAITSYGADYPVDGLVKRMQSKSIYIPPFQRSYVWNQYRASRFVESLLLGLPVPAIFLSREEETQKMLVIDGQQRLRTLQYFYDGIFEPRDKKFRLVGVDDRFAGKTYKDLRDDERRRLDDSIVHAIIVKQDRPLEEDPSSIYHIFERLNTGGVQLQPQEIRACTYHGEFARLLADLNNDRNWRGIFGNVSSRMRDQELILRFFALLVASSDYSKPMKEFLNSFMFRHRHLDKLNWEELRMLFSDTVRIINEAIGPQALKPSAAVNAALADAVMVGMAKRLEKGPFTELAEVRSRYEALLADPRFQERFRSATTDEKTVERRLALATEAFADTP